MYVKSKEGFPSEFLFGAATSAFQVEGNLNKQNRGESILDDYSTNEKNADFSVASDHFNHLEEDVQLMSDLGLQAYRFSVSWVSIFPDGKTLNEAGLHFYDHLIELLLKNKIEPILTIYHFEYPKALVKEYGGWVSEKSVADYIRLAELLFRRYQNKVKYWVTINEQDHVIKVPHRLGISNNLSGLDYENTAQVANANMTVAQAKAIELCHQIIPNSKIGPAVNPIIALSGSSSPKDRVAAHEFEELTYYYMTDAYFRGEYSPLYKKYLAERNIINPFTDEMTDFIKKNTPDFIGINYYMTQTVCANEIERTDLRGPVIIKDAEAGIFETTENNFLEKSKWGWEVCPEGLRLAVMQLYNRYQVPLLITENGLGANDELVNQQVSDNYRISYLHQHLEQLKQCVQEGFPVIGYCAWSFIDLVSGHNGMSKRYGLVYVNRTDNELKNLARIKKNSFHWYQETIKQRGRNL